MDRCNKIFDTRAVPLNLHAKGSLCKVMMDQNLVANCKLVNKMHTKRRMGLRLGQQQVLLKVDGSILEDGSSGCK